MSVARFKPQAEPATPPAGYIYFFCDIADDLLYLKFDTGTVVPVKPVGGGTGDLLSDGSVPLSANWDIGSYTIRALGFESDVATGTAPFIVASETLVANLNAEMLGGKDLATVESDYAAAIAAAVAGLYDHKGAYDAATNTPDLDTAPSGILKGDAYTVSVAGTFFAVAVEAGDVLIADQDNPVDAGDWTIVNRNIDSSAFATAAQGTTADSAVQPGDNANVLGSGAATDGQVLTSDGAGGAAWEDPTGGGGGGLTASVKTANYTITGSEDVGCDSTAGVFTITLKATPSAGDVAFIHDVAFHCGTDAVAIARNGSTINGLAEDASLNTDGGGFWFIYNGTTWLFTPITSGGLSQAEVDARVVAVASGKAGEWFSVAKMWTGSGAPAALTVLGSNGQYQARAFDDTAEEVLFFEWLIPENFDSAAGISFLANWSPNGTSTGNVQWELRVLGQSDGATINSTISGQSLQINDAGNGVGGGTILQTTGLPSGGAKYPSAFTPGQLATCRVQRRPSGGLEDTLVGDAFLIGIKLIYWTDAPTED